MQEIMRVSSVIIYILFEEITKQVSTKGQFNENTINKIRQNKIQQEWWTMIFLIYVCLYVCIYLNLRN